jgi:acyl carrier protein
MSVPGELFIAGEGVASGYHDRDELTRERFLPDPFAPGGRMYRTGDLVRLTHDGEIEYLRRNDGQVKVRGYRIELGEIEVALAAHDGVRGAVVVVREDRPGDARLVAYSIFVPGEEPTEADLRKHLRRRLPDYMVPHHFVEIDAFPLTPNGKIDRRALPAPRRSDDGHVAPRSPTEKLVAGIWEEALGVSSVDARARFFEIGGHSLIAIRVVVEIEKRSGVKLSPLVLLVDSLEQIAAQLEGEKARLEAPFSSEWPTMRTLTRVEDGTTLLQDPAPDERQTPTPPPSSRSVPRPAPAGGMLSKLGRLLRGSR